MNNELIDELSNYITKLEIAKAILHTEPMYKAKTIIKDLTGLDIEILEQRLNA